MKKLLTTLGILAIFSPVVANAAIESGVYAGVSLGSTDLEDEFDNEIYDANSITDKDFDETAYSVYAGYRFNPYLALEAAYIDLGDAEYTYSSTKYEFDFSTITLALIGIAPITDNFELYAQVGAHQWDASASGSWTGEDDGTDMLYGAGVSYHMDDFTFRAEYKQLIVDADGINIKPSIYSVGVQYNF